MKIVGYISSSIGSKIDTSLELKIQRDQIEKYCRDNNFEMLRFYIDEPVGGKNDRSALEEVLSDAGKKEFSRVVVLKFDRLSYDKTLRSKVFYELTKHSVDLLSITEQSILRDPSSQENEAKTNIILRKVKDIPSLPEVVTKVMELVSNPSSSAAELSKVIAHDPGLTTRVLRLVNSAYYGFPKQISSVQQAIMILGFTTMRGLVLSTSIFKIFTSKDSSSGKTIDYKVFWKHSINTALCSRIIATGIGMTEVGDAFSCGILHDIGKVVFDQYDHKSYVEIFKRLRPGFSSHDFIKAEEDIIGINHANIGYRVAEKWNLPLNLSETIRCHHYPLEAVSHAKMVCVVYIANTIANVLATPVPVLNLNLFYPDVLEYLNIDEEKLYELYNSCKEEVEAGGQLDSFFE